MNPFEHIDPIIGLGVNKKENRRSPFYGRYRLAFDQVSPFYEPTYGRAYLKIKKGDAAECRRIKVALPEHIRVIHLLVQKQVRTSWMIDCFEDDDEFLVMELISDVIYIAMENVYFALLQMSSFLEDCHFFTYSTGDADDRWLDEYTIKDGELSLSRHECSLEIYFGRLLFYVERALQNPNNESFKRFTRYQVNDNSVFSDFMNKAKRARSEKILEKISTNSDDLYRLLSLYQKLK